MEPNGALDAETVDHLQKLLSTHRRNLRILLNRAAHYGGVSSAPLDLVNNIHESRTEIRDIKKTLRAGGVAVSDNPVDEPQVSNDDLLVALLGQTPPRPPIRPQWMRYSVLGLGGLVVVALLGLLLTNIPRGGSGDPVPTPTTGSARAIAPSRVPATSGPTAAPHITPSNTPVVVGNPVLLEDDFNSPRKRDLWVHEDDNFKSEFTDGAYIITLKEPRMHIDPAVSRENYGDVAIEVDVDVKGPKTGTAGIVFRYQDDKNYYRYTIDSEGRYSLELIQDQHLSQLIEQATSEAIKVGESNKLRIVAKGDSIQLYANGKLLTEVSDGSFTSGKARLLADSDDDPDITARFDNLLITSVP